MSFLASGRGRLLRELSRRRPPRHGQGGRAACFRRYVAHHLSLDGVDDAAEKAVEPPPALAPPVSLAKSLASLAEESAAAAQRQRKPLSRMERKRLAELRIKKRVKAQYLNGKFYDLMGKVVANADTLEDAYDIVRLNSNVDLASAKDDVCFVTLAEQLRSSAFDVGVNTFSVVAKRQGRGGRLVLPRLNLKVVQEAVRVVLEVVYRPQFSKISHGCRSGRGYHSALRFIANEIGVPDWCFTVSMHKEVDSNVTSKLISLIKEKIEDTQLVAFMQDMFDAKVINLVFGEYPKGHGLPQEGVLAPILMNLYLDSFDHEVFRICLKHEGLGSEATKVSEPHGSNLRRWFRSQLKGRDENIEDQKDCQTKIRLYACRYMDEIFVAVAGSRNAAEVIKSEIVAYLRKSLYLDIDDRLYLMPVRRNSRGLQFAGIVVRVETKENAKLKAVHKLKEKIGLFASQKQEIWDAMNLRVGKKWLAYGLRRVKESEIKSLGLSTPLLDHVAQFRKEGMKTDHWFKTLLKVWMQDVNAKNELNEDVLLSKYIAEPALPQDLRDAFYNFQKQAKDYISSETAATEALLSNLKNKESISACTDGDVIKIHAPLRYIQKCLHRYGLINLEGFPRHVSALVLQDDDLIVSWFAGIINRWMRWFSEVDNFKELQLMLVECVRKSCIRTLSAKYRMYEKLTEKRFELDDHGIPRVEDFEAIIKPLESTYSLASTDEALMYGISCSGLFVLTLSRVRVPARQFKCFVIGCQSASPSMYVLHVKEKQRFPGWRTGFASSIHGSLDGRRIGLCTQHVKDLYLGHISLQSVDFDSLVNIACICERQLSGMPVDYSKIESEPTF
ncbi:nuclear intron maturase 4, mitochondrial-like [Phragmites australis]|uniref:nuclear intron maturase 4, mitochondrial-like n=1 Tax=Phragmites australis TaxID=29695 RepID=UPI002D78C981|nr:nuclear intron maturase 4, mitochondrial-like [Phragmites australis]XP_062229318.1 nuclear intron maturase 4, mitochondrial-like [Phragmites australis]XP_062229319.1 nuclear intron maturase 4, mitochondrial-like [Phragmites australis]XP_062229320.1 nuclear intron maturase 4, mitochondrial-like [Phragmites australis]XP_062229321.1 nuclear intron maturase 4, mitochondrial-like [Phragmites australis]XP_062229322.1 nuclear intron maturase 4, mitochondrial-like [Phragmites australis]XP_06222932